MKLPKSIKSTIAAGAVAISTLQGCGREGYRADPELQPYVQRFEEASGATGKPMKVHSLNVEFDDNDVSNSALGQEMAVCHHGPISNTITVHRNAWNDPNRYDLDGSYKESTMFHELGHCVLNREHLNNTSNGRPVSLMNQTIISGSQYKDHKSEYQKELFEGADPPSNQPALAAPKFQKSLRPGQSLNDFFKANGQKR